MNKTKDILRVREQLDNVLLDIDRVESLNGLVSKLADDIHNVYDANNLYSLSYANDMLLKSMIDKINEIYKIVANLEQENREAN